MRLSLASDFPFDEKSFFWLFPRCGEEAKKKLLSKPWFLFGSNHSPLKWRLTWMSSISFHSWSFSWLKYGEWSSAWRGGGREFHNTLCTRQMFTRSLTKLHFLSPSSAGLKVFCFSRQLSDMIETMPDEVINIIGYLQFIWADEGTFCMTFEMWTKRKQTSSGRLPNWKICLRYFEAVK